MSTVLITIGRLDHGGAEMRLLDLCRGISEYGLPFSPIFYVVSGQAGALDEMFRDAGANIIYGRPGVAGLADFYRTCRVVRPDVVHANGELGAGLYLCAAKLAGVKRRFAHMRSTGYDETGWWRQIRNMVYRPIVNAVAHKVVGVSDATRLLVRTPDSKWQTIYNGIRTSPRDNRMRASYQPLRILMLGRLSYEKNPARILPVVSLLRDRMGDDVTMKYVGGGMLAEELAHQIRKRGLEGAVELAGATNQPMKAASDATVLVLTSRREGLPGVVLEALSVGTPVVSTDLPGVREIAGHVDGVTILAARASDEEWADALIAARTLDREAIAASFAASPFQLEHHLEAVANLWAGQPISLAYRGPAITPSRAASHG